MALEVTPVPCLKDNYAYLLVCTETRAAAVVDPSQPGPVLAALEGRDVTLTAILNTHHHWDHTGGNEALLAAHPGLAVLGHASDRGRIPGQTVFLEHGDTVRVGAQAAEVRHVPGHTTGAVAYCFDGAVFTGDTLFYGGCGRLFEGTAEQMYESLTTKLAEGLPPETKVYCGHEYTASNLTYGAVAEPDNAAIAERLAWAHGEREAGRATIPSTLADELAVNVFVRAGSAERFAELRAAKDSFRG